MGWDSTLPPESAGFCRQKAHPPPWPWLPGGQVAGSGLSPGSAGTPSSTGRQCTTGPGARCHIPCGTSWPRHGLSCQGTGERVESQAGAKHEAGWKGGWTELSRGGSSTPWGLTLGLFWVGSRLTLQWRWEAELKGHLTWCCSGPGVER